MPPYTLHPTLNTLDPEPYTLKSTLHPKTQTPKPKTETLQGAGAAGVVIPLTALGSAAAAELATKVNPKS